MRNAEIYGREMECMEKEEMRRQRNKSVTLE
jgi:hypothetical protein